MKPAGGANLMNYDLENPVNNKKPSSRQVTLGAVMSEVVRLYRYKSLLSNSYGTFNGAPQGWAKLRFTPEWARWVAGENWHPLQESAFEANSSYALSFPYADDRELIGDIMRFGVDVQVLAPPALRTKVQQGFLIAAGRYV